MDTTPSALASPLEPTQRPLLADQKRLEELAISVVEGIHTPEELADLAGMPVDALELVADSPAFKLAAERAKRRGLKTGDISATKASWVIANVLIPRLRAALDDRNTPLDLVVRVGTLLQALQEKGKTKEVEQTDKGGGVRITINTNPVRIGRKADVLEVEAVEVK